jgi:hypothetical protein
MIFGHRVCGSWPVQLAGEGNSQAGSYISCASRSYRCKEFPECPELGMGPIASVLVAQHRKLICGKIIETYRMFKAFQFPAFTQLTKSRWLAVSIASPCGLVHPGIGQRASTLLLAVSTRSISFFSAPLT